MKIGSLVECIDNSMFEEHVAKNTPYTIRDIWTKGKYLGIYRGVKWYVTHDAIFLEEVVTKPHHSLKLELPFPMYRFRELMPPEAVSIEELMKAPIKEFA